MDPFLSTYVNKIDRKGRVSVPASFRAALGPNASSVDVYRALQHDALEACGVDHLDHLAKSLDSLNLEPETYEIIEATIFGSSVHLPFDGEGRISLPEHLIGVVGITENAAFFGRRNTFQIWQPEKLTAYVDTQRTTAKAKDISIAKLMAEANIRARLTQSGGAA